MDEIPETVILEIFVELPSAREVILTEGMEGANVMETAADSFVLLLSPIARTFSVFAPSERKTSIVQLIVPEASVHAPPLICTCTFKIVLGASMEEIPETVILEIFVELPFAGEEIITDGTDPRTTQTAATALELFALSTAYAKFVCRP
ncbi:MAG: hypothetical protein A2Y33_02095 [Spirochaetes bacterium GWF1_51_8]|nr:MAG: hypothetical protein A2Y33_02095 [Spirochaetes bacterium GWF1_51_8]